MPQLAFFPWLELEDDIEIGGYSLKRFTPGSLPRVDEEFRATLDSLLAPYRDTSDNPVEFAVILNRNGRSLIDDLCEGDRGDLFRFAELFAFTALAAREFFISDYFNRDHLRLIIQAFSDPRGGAVVETRRRDGINRSMVPGAIYRVQVPAHVTHPGLKIKPDWALLRALLASREREAWSGLYQGIVLFNQANTDAPDTSLDTELVLTYAAIERILGLLLIPTQFVHAFRRMPSSDSDSFRPLVPTDSVHPFRRNSSTGMRRHSGRPGMSGQRTRAGGEGCWMT